MLNLFDKLIQQYTFMNYFNLTTVTNTVTEKFFDLYKNPYLKSAHNKTFIRLDKILPLRYY